MVKNPNQLIVKDNEPKPTMKNVGIGATIFGGILLLLGAAAFSNYNGECKGYRNGVQDGMSTMDLINSCCNSDDD